MQTKPQRMVAASVRPLACLLLLGSLDELMGADLIIQACTSSVALAQKALLIGT